MHASHTFHMCGRTIAWDWKDTMYTWCVTWWVGYVVAIVLNKSKEQKTFIRGDLKQINLNVEFWMKEKEDLNLKRSLILTTEIQGQIKYYKWM